MIEMTPLQKLISKCYLASTLGVVGFVYCLQDCINTTIPFQQEYQSTRIELMKTKDRLSEQFRLRELNEIKYRSNEVRDLLITENDLEARLQQIHDLPEVKSAWWHHEIMSLMAAGSFFGAVIPLSIGLMLHYVKKYQTKKI